MEKRHYHRFPVQFRSSFTSASRVNGEGDVIDLSIRGCRVSSQAEVPPGAAIELKIHLPDPEPPLVVTQAVVRWCRTKQFGLEFVTLQPDVWDRLRHLVTQLEAQPYLREEPARSVTT
jgi:hypothetical protein